MKKRKKATTRLSKTSGRVSKSAAALPVGYASLLTDLKARVHAAQLRAAVSVNRELILLYWDIGKVIVDAQETRGYGKQVVESAGGGFAKKEFPGVAGLSSLNLLADAGFLYHLRGVRWQFCHRL